MPKVAVIMGSPSDMGFMQQTADTLQSLGIEAEVQVMSAHRTPDLVREYATTAAERGIEVLIAGAGAAAHLPGVLASWSPLPVIGVPLPTSDLKGVDALLAIVQMPSGVPVATVAVGAAGAKNAAYLAAQMLALKYPEVAAAYRQHRQRLSEGKR
ncbi:MAG: 5-(carboxyamino)imidazole ribonucleotide mutase [Chloroflexota bacterium]